MKLNISPIIQSSMATSGFYPPNENLCLQKDHFLVAQVVKNLPAMQENQILSLGREDPLEKEMTTHSITLAWRIPWTGEPSGLWSIGSQRVGNDWVTFIFHYLKKRWASKVALVIKNPLANAEEMWLNPWVGRNPWRRTWQPTSVFLSGEFP